MNQIILATHGELAHGARDTLSMVLGDVSNIHVVSLRRDDMAQIVDRVDKLMESFHGVDPAIILTDMLGSSVSNQMATLAKRWPDLVILTGLNMPLLLEVAVRDGSPSETEIDGMIQRARDGIQDIGALMRRPEMKDGQEDSL